MNTNIDYIKGAEEFNNIKKDIEIKVNMYTKHLGKDKQLDTIRADILLQLVKEHRQHCKGGECHISLFLMKDVYEDLSDCRLTEVGIKDFL